MLSEPLIPPAMAEELVRVRRASGLRIEWRPEQSHARGGGLLWVGARSLEGGVDWRCVAWFEGLHYQHESWQEPVRVAGSAGSVAPMREATAGALLNLLGHLDGLGASLRQHSEDTGRTPGARAEARAHMERSTGAASAVRVLLGAMKALWPEAGAATARDRVEAVALLARLPGSNLYRRSVSAGVVGAPTLPCRRLAAGGECLDAARLVAGAMMEADGRGSSLGRSWVVRAESVGGAAESVAVFEVIFDRLAPAVPNREDWRPPWEFSGWSRAALDLAGSER